MTRILQPNIAQLLLFGNGGPNKSPKLPLIGLFILWCGYDLNKRKKL